MNVELPVHARSKRTHASHVSCDTEISVEIINSTAHSARSDELSARV